MWFDVEVLDPLGLKLCTGWKAWVYLHSSTCWPPVEPAPFAENAIFFQLDGFGIFVKNQVTIGVWVNFCAFYSIPLVYLSVSVPIPCSFYHYCFVILLEFKIVSPLEVLLFLRIVLAILGFLLFQMNWQSFLSNSLKNWIGILMGIALNL